MLYLSLYKGWAVRAALLMALLVGGVGVFLMMGGLGEGQTATERIDYPENGTATVVAYIADDPEGQTVTWSLNGTDSDFDIDGGALTFKSPPDFESPTGGRAGTITLIR